MVFTPFVCIRVDFLSILKLFGIMFLIAVSISSMDIAIASRLRSMQDFQVITNFLLMPMFFLSGAMFPLNNAPQWMHFMARLNPLSYGIDAMRFVILGNRSLQLYPLYVDLIAVLVTAIVFSIIGIFAFNRQD